MTTSDFNGITAPTDFTGNLDIPASLPDVAQLEKIANELFSALPCDGSGSGLGLLSSAAANVFNAQLSSIDKDFVPNPSPSHYGLPGEAELQKLLSPRSASVGSFPSSKLAGSHPDEAAQQSLSSLSSGISKNPLASVSTQGFDLPSDSGIQKTAAPGFTPIGTVPANAGAGFYPDTASAQKLSSPHTGLDKSQFTGISTQGLGLPGEAELQKLLSPRPVSAGSFTDSSRLQTSHPDTAAIQEWPVSSGSRDKSPLAGISTQGFDLPGETELQKLLDLHLLAPKDSAKTYGTPGSSFYFLDERTAKGTNEQAAALASAHPAFDVHAVRRDFPILKEQVNGHQLIWFDNAATTQKPQAVIDRLAYFYQHENSNIHRAAHELAARATDAYEHARDTVARFLNASSSQEIVFARGTTEAINLVAQSWGRKNIGEGDEIVITWLEHHANIVPWQLLCSETGAKLRVAPVDDNGQVLLDEYQKLLTSKTKLVSFTQVSNALGTVTPAQQMIEMAHRVGARVLLDGAQSVSHLRADVQALDCDWFVFSGHKIFGPTGIGALYGKPELLESMPPWQGGGNMIEDVTFEKTIFQPAPARFEAGTGNIADAVGLGAALDYVSKLGIDNIARYEHELLVYAMVELRTIPGLRLIGTAPEKTSVLSFVLAGYNNQDIGVALNRKGIAVRTGHHCAQPILRRFGLESTVRPSLAFYNTYEEIDRLVSAVRSIQGGKEFLQR